MSLSFFTWVYMNLEPKKIKNCLESAQNVREVYFSYHHGSSDLHVSVNKLLEIVKSTYQKKVTLYFHEDSHEKHHIHSFLQINSDDSYDICLMSGMTNCWNRFALCKELFHVILDEESVRNKTLQVHLQDFKASMMDASVDGAESSASEMLTEFAAMQFLFPYAKRLKVIEEFEKRVSEGEAKKDIYKNIAERFRIPRLYVENYLGGFLIDYFDPISWNEKSDER